MRIVFSDILVRAGDSRRAVALRALIALSILGCFCLAPGLSRAQSPVARPAARVDGSPSESPSPVSDDSVRSSDVVAIDGGTVAGVVPGRFLLVSSFQCSPSRPACSEVDAVLRYIATPGPDFGKFDGVHIASIPGPYAMAVHPVRGTLLVASRSTDTIKEYNLHTGVFLGDFIVGGEEGLHLPQYIAFTQSGNLLVTSFPDVANPSKINGVIEFDGTTGAFVRVFVDGGQVTSESCVQPVGFEGDPCLRGPAGFAFGPNGNLFVASSVNSAVIEFNGLTGEHVGFFDSSKLDTPNGIAVRPAGSLREGNILVTSKFPPPPVDADSIVEFDLQTRELVPTNGGVFSQGILNPGPLLWEDAATLLASDRLFFLIPLDYSDRINRYDATTGAFLNNFTDPTALPKPLHFNTGMLMVDLGCQVDADCFDGNPCTDDVCTVEQLCVSTPNDLNIPDDGLFCNGLEDRCEGGVVIFAQPPPDCNDGLSCTRDSCNEALDLCESFLRPNNCLIAGVCFGNNRSNPANDCEACDPVLTTSGWSPVSLGAPCGSQTNSQCDHPDTCDGTGTCLLNYEPADEPCGDGRNDACTAPDACNGFGSCAPFNAPDNTVCSDNDACTVTDRCAGGVCFGSGTPCTTAALPFCINAGGTFVCTECQVDSDCPDDLTDCLDVVCRQDNHTCFNFPNDVRCDDGLFCNGAERCNTATAQCDPGTSPCSINEVCDEASNICVPCQVDADCNDGIFCNGVEVCTANTCVSGPPPDCSSFNSDCTVGTCDSITDQCIAIAGNENGLCDDGDGCTTDDRCVLGVCVGAGPPPNCDDGNLCTTDMCDSVAGCVHQPNTDACDDGDPCTTNDACSGGTCVGGGALNCDDNNECTADSCVMGQGCAHTNTSGACDDGSICTINDICFGGFCLGGGSIDCSDGNPCTDDRCDDQLGCFNPNNVELCDDGDACTTGDVCSGGVCVGGPPPTCDDGNVCTDDVCVGGSCVNTNNVAVCDDGDLCTELDQCLGGACAGRPVDCGTGLVCDSADGQCRECVTDAHCDDGNVCTTDTCVAGVCDRTNNVDPCNDGLFCTLNDACDAGVCVGSGDACPGRRCDEAGGLCVDCLTDPDCDDGNFCNGLETCTANICVSGTDPCPGQMCDEGSGTCVECFLDGNCNDGNECTDDSCVSGVCMHANNTNPCDDGLFCTLDDMCGAGSCVGSGDTCPKMCDENLDACVQCINAGDCLDGNVCTDDSCVAGACVHTPNNNACDDNLFCTVTDVCSGGVCIGTGMPCVDKACNEETNTCVDCLTDGQCDDGNVCTDDTCVDTFCIFTANTGPCDDGLFCTVTDVCVGGQCSGSVNRCPNEVCDETNDGCVECLDAADCTDGDGCTTDACDLATNTCTHQSRGCRFADVAPEPNGDCDVTVDDILCVLNGFADPQLCPRGDLFPCGGDGQRTLDDILAVIQAFEGNAPCVDTCE